MPSSTAEHPGFSPHSQHTETRTPQIETATACLSKAIPFKGNPFQRHSRFLCLLRRISQRYDRGCKTFWARGVGAAAPADPTSSKNAPATNVQTQANIIITRDPPQVLDFCVITRNWHLVGLNVCFASLCSVGPAFSPTLTTLLVPNVDITKASRAFVKHQE